MECELHSHESWRHGECRKDFEAMEGSVHYLVLNRVFQESVLLSEEESEQQLVMTV